VLQGPMLLELKQAARDLLLSQGMAEQDLPLPLRSGPRVERTVADGLAGRALTLVNGTGYLPKPLNVGKALLYSLSPPGSVLKIPDSLWNATFYAGLLVGACLRGATVSVVAPALANAPSGGFPQMSRAHELMVRLVVARRELGDAMRTAGGQLRTGLYALAADQNGFASRADLWSRQVATSASLRALMPFTTDLVAVVGEAGVELTEARAVAGPQPPKLHQKVQFFATKALWDAIARSPEWPQFMSKYLRYRAATYSAAGEYAEAEQFPEELERIAQRLFAGTRGVARAAGYALVGSQNQDYRGMFMDGEVAVLFSGAQALVPLVDLVFLEGTVTWVDDEEALGRLLPPVGELKRRLARVIKDAV
jgi:hypothetical protein